MKKILLFFIGFISTIVIVDFYLRFAEIITPGATIIDPTIGTLTSKNKDVTMFNEGFFMGATNEFGYWGPGYPHQKDKDVFRIVLLGDSYIEGLQLFDRDHLRTIIENKLKKELRMRVEVLKVGYSGLNLESMYCYYKDFAQKFNPDFTLFFVKNPDVFNLKPVSYYPTIAVDSVNNKIKIVPISLTNRIVRNKISMQKYSGKMYFLTLLKNDLSLIQNGECLHILLDKFYPQDEISESSGLKNDFTLSVEVRLVLKELGQNGNVGVVNLGTLDKKFVYELYMNNIIFIDPLSTLSVRQKKDFSYWKATNTIGHWNQKGHKFIGNFIADKLFPIINEKLKIRAALNSRN